jgi:hypothetical protein
VKKSFRIHESGRQEIIYLLYWYPGLPIKTTIHNNSIDWFYQTLFPQQREITYLLWKPVNIFYLQGQIMRNRDIFSRLNHLLIGLLMFLICGCGDSGSSSSDDITAPGEVTGFQISFIGAGFMIMSWSDPGDSDLDHITISMEPAHTGPVSIVKGAGSAILTGLTTGTSCTITVTTVDTSGNTSSGRAFTLYMPADLTMVTFISSSDGAALNTLLGDDALNGTGGYYILGTDVDLSGVAWTPVGDGTNRFTGTFDGGGHTISNLTINTPGTDFQGFFGYLDTGGIVTNVGLEDIDVTGNDYTGGLVGYSNGTVENCYATGTVSGSDYAGGLAGWNNSTIENSHATGGVSGSSDVGGLVGRSIGTVLSSYATGTVSGSNYYSGGLVGYNNSTVENSYAAGTVSGNDYVGGLVGYNNYGTVENSYAIGDVTGNDFVGGLVGRNYNTVTGSYATGVVNGTTYVGGLIGSDYSVSYTACFWLQETGGTNDGLADIGFDEDTTTFNINSANIFATSTANLKLPSTFTAQGWDFADETANGTDDTWSMDSGTNSGFPYLTGLLSSY